MAKKKKIEWINCSESDLPSKIHAWIKSLNPKSSVIFLEGEMGSGKSTFARILIQTLAPKSRSAGSPTFPLVQEYQGEGGLLIHHIDLYRLKTERELLDSGIEENIGDEGLKLIEWGSLFESAFSYLLNGESTRGVWTIHIESGKPNPHGIIF